MRIQRLVIETSGETLTFALHPRLTVVTGMGEGERESLASELIGALSSHHPGVHLELEDRGGRHLAVFSPLLGPHRIIDVDSATDVSAEFANSDGNPDLLEPLGLDLHQARSTMRFGASDLVIPEDLHPSIKVLAALDQRQLWTAAQELQDACDDLANPTLAPKSAAGDPAIVEEVMTRHDALAAALASFETTRRRTFLIGAFAACAIVPGKIYGGTIALILFAAVAATSVLISLIARAKVIRANAAAARSLSKTGACSQFGFQLQRLNDLLGEHSDRSLLMDRADARRRALAEWVRLAQDIPFDWAGEHRQEIEAAARLHEDVASLDFLLPDPTDPTGAETASLLRVLIARLAQVSSVAQEGLPLLLDDPFRGLAAGPKLALLELVGRSSGDPQIILFTDDEDVVSWARMEAIGGEMTIIEAAVLLTADPLGHL
jgi:hypothetical protein